MELRQLRYFVTLAEELNFRRAAERLFITQPSLSHQIALFETTLGVRLFERDRRRVALTDAGKALLEDARLLLTEASALVEKAHRMVAADSAALEVGIPPDANRIFIPDIVAGFRRQYPTAKLSLREGYSRELLPGLRAGRLDVVFARIPTPLDLTGLTVEPILDEETGLLLGGRHPLAARAEIPVNVLDGQQMVMIDRPLNPPLYDEVTQWLQQAGVQPRFLRIGGVGAYTFSALLQVLESGEAVSLTGPTVARDLPPGVVFRPLCPPPPSFRVAALWSSSNGSPALRDFLSVARELRDARKALLGQDPANAIVDPCGS